MADKLDPFDVEALESAVNNSATRVSAIWISFLIFALYLLIAATTVTQRQLLLADPIKLPVLNIDLPLWGFFFLAPILFVIFHVYTLLQVLLLGRTTAAYNNAVARLELSPMENTSLRQRLANTLFAQIFAGSPREREGFIGWLLRVIVWITLAIAPILVVLAFQFSFLAYHSHIATWTHRLLILVELLAFFLIWPLALNAQQNFQWPKVGANLKRLTVIPQQMFGPKEIRDDARLWLREATIPLLACILFLIIPLSLATFPGEPHLNLFTGEALTSVQCERWLNLLDLRFDRLSLSYGDIVDRAQLERIEEATKKAAEKPFQGERTRILGSRDLNCAIFSNVDMRRVDLSRSSLRETSLHGAKLEGADLGGAQLEGADLVDAQLQGANLGYAELQGANLARAQLQGVELSEAQLQGANLIGAQLQGVELSDAQLQGTHLRAAQLQGADLSAAQLQGADLRAAQLQGADLRAAQLQGADLRAAQLQGADLGYAELPGADLDGADLDHSVLAKVLIWRARNAACTNARIASPLTNVIENRDGEAISATSDAIAEFIDRSVAEIPDADDKAKAANRMRERLVIDLSKDDTETIAKVWSTCERAETSTMPQEKFDEQRAAVLRDSVCNASENREAIAAGIFRNWLYNNTPLSSARLVHGVRSIFSVQLARGLLGQDGKECAATKNFDNATMARLKEAAAAMVIPAAAPPK